MTTLADLEQTLLTALEQVRRLQQPECVRAEYGSSAGFVDVTKLPVLVRSADAISPDRRIPVSDDCLPLPGNAFDRPPPAVSVTR